MTVNEAADERASAAVLDNLGFVTRRLNAREMAANDAAWAAYGSPGSDPAAKAEAHQRYLAAYAAAMADPEPARPYWVAPPRRVEVTLDVPMKCFVTVDVALNKVTKVVFLPLEGDAGYFGRRSSIEAVDRDAKPVDISEWADVVPAADAEPEEFLWNADWEILGPLTAPNEITWEG